MYFWKINDLVEDVKNKKLEQKDQLKYVIAFSIIMIFSSDPMMTVGLQYSTLDSVSTVLTLVIALIGIYWCYQENQKADDQDFILRFFTVGLPVAVRFTVILIPVAILLGMLEVILTVGYQEAMVKTSSIKHTSLYQVIFFALAQLIFYRYYSSQFRLFTKS